MSRDLGDGLRFERRIEMVEHYRLRIVDRYLNGGTAAVKLPECRVTAGRMETVKSQASAQGVSYLGIDTLADVGGAKVKDWGKKDIPRMFGAQGGGCMRQGADLSRTPVQVSEIVAQPQTWLAARNKFFVLILKPDDPADNCVLHAERDPDGKALHVQAVSGELGFSANTIEPGGSFERSFHYYVGPKDYALLKTLGARQHEIMLHAWWEWFRWICGAMLWTLNALYKVIPNYGVAIILLTAIVRILFWPITHKSTESMKRMQQVQPLVTELRAKFKDKPQKLNQEIMALYKEHKVNPMAGCLPMLVQMPVFIALYNVLRAAVELRYAGFLWIRDLSEPEGLLQGVIPVVGCLNIWPLLMTATMVWQQKLTPAAGDPAQQKMMLWFMPIFMLFILYSMPSGLIVYWTVSQVLSIVQMLHQRRMWAAKSALAKA